MQIRLSDHFTYRRLLRFTLPSVVTMIIASIYSVVDGLFVSNLVGAMALSAINIAFPVTMIIGAVGFMLGTGAALTILALLFVRPIMGIAGASDLLMEDCVIYGTILLAGSVPFML